MVTHHLGLVVGLAHNPRGISHHLLLLTNTSACTASHALVRVEWLADGQIKVVLGLFSLTIRVNSQPVWGLRPWLLAQDVEVVQYIIVRGHALERACWLQAVTTRLGGAPFKRIHALAGLANVLGLPNRNARRADKANVGRAFVDSTRRAAFVRQHNVSIAKGGCSLKRANAGRDAILVLAT